MPRVLLCRTLDYSARANTLMHTAMKMQEVKFTCCDAPKLLQKTVVKLDRDFAKPADHQRTSSTNDLT